MADSNKQHRREYIAAHWLVEITSLGLVHYPWRQSLWEGMKGRTMKTFSNKTNSLRSGQDSQAIQTCNCKVKRFKSVIWHDDGSSGYTLGRAVYTVTMLIICVIFKCILQNRDYHYALSACSTSDMVTMRPDVQSLSPLA